MDNARNEDIMNRIKKESTLAGSKQKKENRHAVRGNRILTTASEGERKQGRKRIMLIDEVKQKIPRDNREGLGQKLMQTAQWHKGPEVRRKSFLINHI